MKKLITILILFYSTSSFAENHDQIPSLSEALESAGEDQLANLDFTETSFSEMSIDLDAGDLIVTSIEQGDFSPEDIEFLGEAAEILEANIDFFDFDIVATIQDALAQGNVTEEEVAYTLMIFSTLSSADRTVVAQESFSGDTSDASWGDISAAGQATICNAGLATGNGC